VHPSTRPNPGEIDRDALRRLITEAISNAGGVQRLATAAGINVSNLHAYRHTRVPHWATCSRLAAGGGVSEAALLKASGWGDRIQVAHQPPSALTALEPGFNSLDTDRKSLFVRLAKALITELKE
jgi:hypothetical protein